MTVSLRNAILGSLLLAVAAQGTDGAAPLETSRQELRKLQSGQKAGEAPSAKEGLRPGLPTLVTPGQESLPSPELWSPEKLEKERKLQKEKEARKNWLVYGVQQLEKSDRAKEGLSRSGAGKLSSAEADRDSDSQDPQYLLKLYDEQKKIDTERQADSKPQRAAPVDPLAPFLQDWLGNSPARGQFFDEFARKPDAGPVGSIAPLGAAVASGGYAPLTTPGQAGGDKAPATRAPNPYLADLAPIRSSEPVAPLGAPGTLNPAAAMPVFSQPITAAPTPPAEVRQPEKKAPPPAQTDDRKYFPQLNRF